MSMVVVRVSNYESVYTSSSTDVTMFNGLMLFRVSLVLNNSDKLANFEDMSREENVSKIVCYKPNTGTQRTKCLESVCGCMQAWVSHL